MLLSTYPPIKRLIVDNHVEQMCKTRQCCGELWCKITHVQFCAISSRNGTGTLVFCVPNDGRMPCIILIIVRWKHVSCHTFVDSLAFPCQGRYTAQKRQSGEIDEEEATNKEDQKDHASKKK